MGKMKEREREREPVTASFNEDAQSQVKAEATQEHVVRND
jgi:hypothetical protein